MKVPLLGAFSDVLPMPRLARNWKRSWILEMMFRWMESQSLWLQLSSRYVWPSNSAVWANGTFLLWGSNESLWVGSISGEQKAFSSKKHFYLMAWYVCVHRGACTIEWPWFSHADMQPLRTGGPLAPPCTKSPPAGNTVMSTCKAAMMSVQCQITWQVLHWHMHKILWWQQHRCSL